MSRLTKVNKDHYTMAGRLTPDEIARERMSHQPRPAPDRPRRAKPSNARHESKRAKQR